MWYIQNNYLAHYGVLGMHWGIRRYQPYSVKPRKSGKSGKEVGEAAQKYKLKKYTSPKMEDAKDKVRDYAKLVTYLFTPYAFADMAIQKNREKKIYLDKTDYMKKEGPPEQLSNLRKKNKITTPEDDVKNVNPRTGKYQAGKINNCGNCVMAFEMRRRGYDVIARSSSKGVYSNQYKDWFQDISIKNYNGARQGPEESRKDYINRAYNDLCNAIERNGNGSRGLVGLCYETSEGTNSGGGHVFSWEVIDNRVVFFDGQSGRIDDDKVFALGMPKTYQYARLDNLKVKPEITQRVRSNPK